VSQQFIAPVPPAPALDEPGAWLHSTPLLDLEDSKLRLRARSLTQLCKTEREKALAVYAFVKRIPFAKPFKMRLHTPREVLDAGRGDAPDKIAVLVGLLRLAGIPARIRYVELRGEILRGLTSSMASASRPIAEAYIGGRWVRTDTYIFDAAYMAAARSRLKEQGWDWGYGIHVNGQTIWNGLDDAFLGGVASDQDPMRIQDWGVFSDPLEFVSSPNYRTHHPRIARAVHWNVLSPLMERAIRDLRQEGPTASGGVSRKPS
jgi:hypothetical protein